MLSGPPRRLNNGAALSRLRELAIPLAFADTSRDAGYKEIVSAPRLRLYIIYPRRAARPGTRWGYNLPLGYHFAAATRRISYPSETPDNGERRRRARGWRKGSGATALTRETQRAVRAMSPPRNIMASAPFPRTDWKLSPPRNYLCSIARADISRKRGRVAARKTFWLRFAIGEESPWRGIGGFACGCGCGLHAHRHVCVCTRGMVWIDTARTCRGPARSLFLLLWWTARRRRRRAETEAGVPDNDASPWTRAYPRVTEHFRTVSPCTDLFFGPFPGFRSRTITRRIFFFFFYFARSQKSVSRVESFPLSGLMVNGPSTIFLPHNFLDTIAFSFIY